jgi:ADP-ribosyl-[dinitrogen reductase] hydrolase
MLVEAAIGDTYGAAYEYADTDFVQSGNDGKTYRANPKYPTRGLKYTDDAQMGMSVQEMMLDGATWTKLNCATYFLRAFKRDPRTGYARGFYSVLNKVNTPEELLETLGDATSDKSGGAMRAFPIGMYPSKERVMNVAAIQASVTHNTPAGMLAAQASAMMTHYFCYQKGVPSQLGTYIKKQVPRIEDAGEWDEPYAEPVGAKGWMSVKAAITAIQPARTLTEILYNSIAFTGDVDTVATIALAAASWSPEIKNDLDPGLYDGLENGKYGHDYMKWLDNQLRLKFSAFLP